MLFYLKSNEGSLLYLLKDEYTVGRKEADILLTNDQSISRNHALIKKQNNRIILTDRGAKYKTYVNDSKLEPHRDTILSPGNVIKFGAFESIYKLGCVNIVTTYSCLTSDEKKRVIQQMKFLNGYCVSNWTPECTHLTVNELKLTVKMLCSLIEGKPIVTVKFWEDFVSNIKENLPPPDPNNYKPPCTEIMLNKNLPLNFKEERKLLFRDKVFVFTTESDKKTVELVVKCAGGECVSLEKQQITKEDLNNPNKEYLIVQNTDSQTKILSQELIDLTEHLKQTGKRLIPFTELALAVVNCSCEKDCNPNFDRNAALLNGTSSQPAALNNILVTETQTQQEVLPKNTQHDTVIYPSFDNSVCNSQNFKPKGNSTFVEPKLPNKRGAEDQGEKVNDSVSKKAKSSTQTENFGFFTNKQNKENSKGNTLFDFFTSRKNDKDVSSSGTSDAKEKNISTIETKKRKFVFSEQDENLQPPQAKKQNSSSEVDNRMSATAGTVIDADKLSFYKNILKNSMNHFPVSWSINPKSASNIVLEPWLDDPITKTEEVLKQENIDDEMLQFVNSFRNSVVVVEKNLIKSKPKDDTLSTNVSSNLNKKNFKKFRKIKPLKEQTTIIPRSECVRVVCNSDAILQPEAHEDDDNDDDDVQLIEGPVQSKQPNTKKKMFKFEL